MEEGLRKQQTGNEAHDHHLACHASFLGAHVLHLLPHHRLHVAFSLWHQSFSSSCSLVSRPPESRCDLSALNFLLQVAHIGLTRLAYFFLPPSFPLSSPRAFLLTSSSIRASFQFGWWRSSIPSPGVRPVESPHRKFSSQAHDHAKAGRRDQVSDATTARQLCAFRQQSRGPC